MTLVEICLVIVTAAIVGCAVALLAIVTRMGSTLRLLEELTVETRESVRRIDQVGLLVQGLLRRANSDYTQVRDVAGDVFSNVIVPLRTTSALVRGLRAGARALFARSSPPTDRSPRP
jgi:hypothetical protein